MISNNEKIKVKLLTLNYCDSCLWLKKELDDNKISYIDIDADTNLKFTESIEERFKTNSYPIVFIDANEKTTIIVPNTSLETTDTLRTFNTIPELVETIKSYIK